MSCSRICLTASCVLFGVLFVLSIAFYFTSDRIVQSYVLKQLVLTEGSQGYMKWSDQSGQPIYMQYWLFDLQNLDEVSEGGKPFVKEKGPFTYLEKRWKENITRNNNGTITYDSMKSFHFLREKSCCSEEESVTTPDLVAATYIHNLGPYESLSWLERGKLFVPNGFLQLFINMTVREALWGYQHPMIRALPVFFSDSAYGVMRGKNMSSDGKYTVFTGETDPLKVGQIDRVNGRNVMDVWNDPKLNVISGFDGTIVPPFFLKKSTIFKNFVPDLCRSFAADFLKETATPQGIPLLSFVSGRLATKYPYEWGKENNCTPDCSPAGTFNISRCGKVDGMEKPIFSSAPHFLSADKAVQDNILGLHPVSNDHATFTDYEPTTGYLMQASKRLQINLDLEPFAGITTHAKVRKMLYPVVWLNESVVISDVNAEEFSSRVAFPLEFVKIARIVAIAVFGVCFVGLVIGLVVSSCRSRKAEDFETSGKDDFLLQRSDLKHPLPSNSKGDGLLDNLYDGE